MPDYSKPKYLASNVSSYIFQEDGWVYIWHHGEHDNYPHHLYINGNPVVSRDDASNSMYSSVFIPINKGDIATTSYSGKYSFNSLSDYPPSSTSSNVKMLTIILYPFK